MRNFWFVIIVVGGLIGWYAAISDSHTPKTRVSVEQFDGTIIEYFQKHREIDQANLKLFSPEDLVSHWTYVYRAEGDTVSNFSAELFRKERGGRDRFIEVHDLNLKKVLIVFSNQLPNRSFFKTQI